MPCCARLWPCLAPPFLGYAFVVFGCVDALFFARRWLCLVVSKPCPASCLLRTGFPGSSLLRSVCMHALSRPVFATQLSSGCVHSLFCLFFAMHWPCPCLVPPLLCYAVDVSMPCPASSLLRLVLSMPCAALSLLRSRCVHALSRVFFVSMPCPATSFLLSGCDHALSRLFFAMQRLSMTCPLSSLLRSGCVQLRSCPVRSLLCQPRSGCIHALSRRLFFDRRVVSAPCPASSSRRSGCVHDVFRLYLSIHCLCPCPVPQWLCPCRVPLFFAMQLLRPCPVPPLLCFAVVVSKLCPVSLCYEVVVSSIVSARPASYLLHRGDFRSCPCPFQTPTHKTYFFLRNRSRK